MNLFKYFGFGFLVYVAGWTCASIFNVISLIRMNAQHCIPETSMFDYFHVERLYTVGPVYGATFVLIYLFIEGYDRWSYMLPDWNIPSPPQRLMKVLYYISVSILVVGALALVALLIYLVFIKNPC